VIDLKKARDHLAQHWDPLMKDEYTWPCPECGEDVHQLDARCIVCDVPVVWRNSPVWRQRYGTSGKVEERLRATPEDDQWDAITDYLFRKGNRPGRWFPNVGLMDKWFKYKDVVPVNTIVSLIDNYNGKPHALVNVVVNQVAARGRRKAGNVVEAEDRSVF